MAARSPEYLLNEACRVLAEIEPWVWDGRTLPVPIDEIAEDHFGLLIREVVDIGDNLPGHDPHPGTLVSGALLPERAEIWIDATEASRWPRRRRYTIAHEIGHWVMHRGPDTTMCREATVEPVDVLDATPDDLVGHGRDEHPIEWEANVFGGALLLPPNLVRDFLREGSIDEIPDAFDVSPSAMSTRWRPHVLFAQRRIPDRRG